MSQSPSANPVNEQLLQALRQARTKIEALQQARDEAIAIVGIGCRFPLVSTPQEFWTVLQGGVDATCEVPLDRPEFAPFYDPDPALENRAYTRRGGFLRERPDSFDAAFFGIADREAEAMDPQQRLLLEVTWEALEDAAIPADSLRKTATGVFIGLSTDDYHRATTSARKPETFSPYAGLGTARSIAAGRISFAFGWQGPCVQVDTACSSSLVAVHLACQSLGSGESTVALAGGVNLVLSPISTIGRCRMRALSPDGRCKSFDASADGYGQGEGCGVVVLKRVSDAIRDGNRIYGVLRGSAVNHDGPSSGLTTPNELAQEQLLRRALANANVEPAEIMYVEAHGTGTSLGDPIEVNALASVFRRRSDPLLLGSVKSNFGHAEAAAGMACLIKTALALHYNEIPPHLHFRTPNPNIDWSNVPVKVVTERTPWPQGRRLAGVSAFGLSGTNAHVILEEAPPATPPDLPQSGPHLLCVSAKSRQALSSLITNYVTFLRATDLPLAAICATANRGRNHWEWRVAAVAETNQEMAARLETAALPDAPVSSHAEAIAVPPPSIAGMELQALAERYRKGGSLRWPTPSAATRTVSLPRYPFSRKHYWSQALPPIQPETAVQALLDRGDVDGLCALLGQSGSGEARRLLESLTARYLGRESERTYQLHWASAASDAFQQSRAVRWTMESASGTLPPSFVAWQQEFRTAAPSSEKAARGVIWTMDPNADPSRQAVLLLARLQQAQKDGVQLWAVSLGQAPGVAAAVGLGRSAALEMSTTWRGWLQLPETPSTADWRAAAIAIQADTRESAIRISNGKSQVLRLRRHALPAVAQPFKLRPGDEYLITGGTGAVGWHFARWLVRHGATRLVLTGRTAAGEPRWAELRAGGVDIQIVAADASDLAAMQTLIARLSRLRGVIHAAGIGGFDPIAHMTESSLRDVLRPKVEGGWNLHLATQGLPLDFFVVCSSIASVWGSGEQAHYAAGNQFLDCLAAYRRSLGLPAVSVNWGPWAGTLSGAARQWLERSGIMSLNPAEALATLERILASGETQVTVANVDWDTFLSVYEARGQQPLMNDLRGSPPVASTTRPPKQETLTFPATVAHLQALVARVLGGQTVPDTEQGFAELGLDSLMAVELKKLVEETFGRQLSATVVFNYPSISRLAAHLIGQSDPAVTPSTPQAAAVDARQLLAQLAQEAEE